MTDEEERREFDMISRRFKAEAQTLAVNFRDWTPREPIGLRSQLRAHLKHILGPTLFLHGADVIVDDWVEFNMKSGRVRREGGVLRFREMAG